MEVMPERRMITGETWDEAVERFIRTFPKNWKELPIAERRDFINRFRSGII